MSLSQSNNARILIVDDDTILASLYRIKLTQAGYSVDIAESGEAGLLKIAQWAPNLVILDLMLGDMNGVELLEVLRKNEATRALPVIVFSSAYLGGLIEAATRAGANKCLNKANCPPQRLLDEVGAILVPNSTGLGGVALPAQRPLAPLPKPRIGAPPALSAPPPPSAVAGAPVGQADTQENLRREVAEEIRKRVEEIGRLLPKWLGSAHNPDAPYLPALYRGIRTVAANAGLVGCARLAQMAGALEALLKKVKTSPAALTASVRRTIEQTVEMLPSLVAEAGTDHVLRALEPLILVLDRDRSSLNAIDGALENARLRALLIADGAAAARLLEWNCFDLVIVGLESGDCGGLDFVARLREDSTNREAPLVALCETPELDKDARAAAGEPSEFIARPFLSMELALKALVSLQRAQAHLGG